MPHGPSPLCNACTFLVVKDIICTCLELLQCARQSSHEQSSGRQSHASFEGYTHICPFQQQQTHTGEKIQ